MEVNIEESSHGWDSTFFTASSYCMQPLCDAFKFIGYRLFSPLTPSKFDFYDTLAKETAFRTAIAAGSAALLATAPGLVLGGALGLGVVGKAFRAVALKLQKNECTHIRGKAEEVTPDDVKILSANVGGIAGGMQYDRCGVGSWEHRFHAMMEKIEKEDPDVIVLQEIYDTALCDAIVKRLSEKYAHFFTQLGPNFLGSVGGVMMITKAPVKRFATESFENNSWQLNRTFSTLEIKTNNAALRIIGTHLIHDNNENRIEQFEQIKKSLLDKTIEEMPTLIVGDLNMEHDDPSQGGVLDKDLINSLNYTEHTATEQLVWQWTGNETGPADHKIDYISGFKKQDGLRVSEDFEFTDTRLIDTYPGFDTKTALSDHKWPMTTVKLKG